MAMAFAMTACATHQTDMPGVRHYLGYVKVSTPQPGATDSAVTTVHVGLRVDIHGASLGYGKATRIELTPGCFVITLPAAREQLSQDDRTFLQQLSEQFLRSSACLRLIDP